MCVQCTTDTATVCLTNVRRCHVPYRIAGGSHVWHAILSHMFSFKQKHWFQTFWSLQLDHFIVSFGACILHTHHTIGSDLWLYYSNFLRNQLRVSCLHIFIFFFDIHTSQCLGPDQTMNIRTKAYLKRKRILRKQSEIFFI